MVISRIFASFTFWFRSFFALVKLLLNQTEPNHAVVVRQTDGSAAVEHGRTDSCPTLELTVTVSSVSFELLFYYFSFALERASDDCLPYLHIRQMCVYIYII